ncbi:MAG: hypothetical protein WC596_04965 [Candidatus Shapirobacteria bacterium]
MKAELLDHETIDGENKKGRIDVGVMEEKLGIGEDVLVSGKPKKEISTYEQKLLDNFDDVYKEFVGRLDTEIFYRKDLNPALIDYKTLFSKKYPKISEYGLDKGDNLKTFLNICYIKLGAGYNELLRKIDELNNIKGQSEDKNFYKEKTKI